ncbi:MAG: hypothetical protein KGL39_16680 [Patescibacteria group bacterium]|nr:hypothetical protein [Patescibacteria group bacterium]
MPVPTLITDLSQTASSNYPAGSNSPSDLDDVQRAHGSFTAMLRDGKGFSNPATLASATTTDIGGQNSLAVEITGTTTITGFGTNYNGPRYLRFTGALTLTHNATTLNLPYATNITTVAGDTCIAYPNSALNGWNVVMYQYSTTPRAPTQAAGDNSTAIATTAFIQGLTRQGQCKFAYVSATSCSLTPYKGNQLTINGVNYTIPSAGVTIANTSMSANTSYYIYAYMNAGTMTLEFSTTGHSVDTTTGQEIKTGDATRTLVGAVRTNGSSQFSNSATARLVRSWFNDNGVAGSASLGSNLSVGFSPYNELSTALRLEVMLWGGESVVVNGGHGGQDTGSANVTLTTTSNMDGANGGRQGQATSYAGTYSQGAFGAVYTPTEGYHYLTIYGGQSGGSTPFFLATLTGHEYKTVRA